MPKFETKYGFFSDDGNEYVIKTYRTPKPWINVVSNGQYGLVISQTGGGFSWLTHSEFNRLNRWHQDLIKDDWGKYFYIKNNVTGEVWSPTWMPAKSELDNYECRHGFGYTKFTSIFKGIAVLLTVFIPRDENLEIWNFEIENQTDKKVNLSICSYFEWCLGSSADHHREFHKTFLETHFDESLNAMLAAKRLWEIPIKNRGHWNTEYPYLGFISSSAKISEYEGDKEAFLGQYGSLDKPVALLNLKFQRKTGKWSDSIAAVKIDLEIESNSSTHTAFYIGIQENKNQIKRVLKKFQSKEQIDKALSDVKSYWLNLFSTLEIETPDEAMNLMVNKWLRYQAIAGRLWGRTAYYQQSGAYGFRDQLQDSLVFLPIDPSQTEKQIRLHARHQFKNGTVLHWWHPITETGLQTNMTDDLLWLPFVLLQYIDETNDYSILKKKEPFYDDNKNAYTLFDHCIAAIERVGKRISKRGIPLIGSGDWNDGLSAVGLDMKGESIWLAEFYYLILIRFSDLCGKIKIEKLAKRYSSKAKKLREAFDEHAWDGKWFFRATKDNGEKIGSRKNKEGKIYLNSQTWSVISGIASHKKQQLSMDAVTKFLLKRNGTLLLYPAYTKPDEMIGYLSRYAPGRRENGGVYMHAAAWALWAYSILKQNDLSFKVFEKTCPVYNGMNPDEYLAEPYVTPGNIDGPGSPNYGMGGWSWYTGSASWFQKIIVDWILGVRASSDGLVIDPCIPNSWKSYKVKRTFRGIVFNITVNNSGTGKICKILVNGQQTSTNVLNIHSEVPVIVEVFCS